ncbi:unnamed protein product [Schistosoma mattheei]|uniref:Uncharacterized protein n=1 Tax=Schistosoma mattheei TaxID=31246 RepID=A0A183NWB4_9TREM|nr:unnamed protein product [Schistosoma mattheei]
MSELKKRAYLAQYLVKVSIPVDFMQDEEIAGLYQQIANTDQRIQITQQQLKELRKTTTNSTATGRNL